MNKRIKKVKLYPIKLTRLGEMLFIKAKANCWKEVKINKPEEKYFSPNTSIIKATLEAR